MISGSLYSRVFQFTRLQTRASGNKFRQRCLPAIPTERARCHKFFQTLGVLNVWLRPLYLRTTLSGQSLCPIQSHRTPRGDSAKLHPRYRGFMEPLRRESQNHPSSVLRTSPSNRPYQVVSGRDRSHLHLRLDSRGPFGVDVCGRLPP